MLSNNFSKISIFIKEIYREFLTFNRTRPCFRPYIHINRTIWSIFNLGFKLNFRLFNSLLPFRKWGCWQGLQSCYSDWLLQIPTQMIIIKSFHAMHQIRTVFSCPWWVQGSKGLFHRFLLLRLNKIPKMTFKIKESYFESISVLARNRDSYTKIDGWYHQTIDGADLSVEFMQNEDCKYIDLNFRYCQNKDSSPLISERCFKISRWVIRWLLKKELASAWLFSGSGYNQKAFIWVYWTSDIHFRPFKLK